MEDIFGIIILWPPVPPTVVQFATRPTSTDFVPVNEKMHVLFVTIIPDGTQKTISSGFLRMGIVGVIRIVVVTVEHWTKVSAVG